MTTDDLQVDISFEPKSYVVGEKGELSAELINTSNSTLILTSAEFRLPKNFFDGFVIIYPTNPKLEKVVEDWLSNKITLSNLRLESGDIVVLSVGVQAQIGGDYSGEYVVEVFTGEDTNFIGSLEDSFQLDVNVLLPEN